MSQQPEISKQDSRFDGKTKSLMLFGADLEYSQSPQLHNRWIAEEGLNLVYVPLALPTEEAFVAAALALTKSPNFLGGNITNPFKRALLAEHLGFQADERTMAIGSANTIFKKSGSQGDEWWLTNTDVEGVLATLELWPSFRSSAPLEVIILGAGGAAASVVWSVRLARPDASITIVCRNSQKASSFLSTPLAAANFFEISEETFALGDSSCLRILQNSQLSEASANRLLVNCIPIGNKGEPNPAAESLIVKLLAPAALQSFFFDLAYGASHAVNVAAAHNVPHQDGKVMLKTQALRCFAIWKDSAAPRR